MKKNESGFTLIEVIVVASIIAILAGILVPLIFKEIDEAKQTRAKADVASISQAMLVMRKDTGQWPVTGTCAAGTTLLYGSGTVPTLGTGWDGATGTATYDSTLSQDSGPCWPTTWKGPYIATVDKDPWGHAYVTNAAAMVASGTPPIWIISAGPDGALQTATTDLTQQSDDIGIRIQ